MAHDTSINLHNDTLAPSGDVLTIEQGNFITFRFTTGFSVILPAFDADASRAARDCAAVLLALADEMDVKLSEVEAVR